MMKGSIVVDFLPELLKYLRLFRNGEFSPIVSSIYRVENIFQLTENSAANRRLILAIFAVVEMFKREKD